MTPVQSRPSIVKKASKLSFGMKRDKGKDREPSMDKKEEKEKEKEKDPSSRPSGGTLMTTASSGSSSFFNVSSNHTVVATGENQPQANGLSPPSSYMADVETSPPRSHSPAISNKTKVLPPIPRDFAIQPTPPQQQSSSPLPTGEIDRELFESMGNNSLSVRFEINIVKVRFALALCECWLIYSCPRCPGCRCTVFNSAVQVEMAGNTRCWPGVS